jgi:N-acetylornithine carbamoyltransferase
MKRFVDLADLQRDEIRDLLELARRLESHPEPQALAGKILGLVFFNPSLRTLASFQAGMAKMGGSTFVITPGQGTWQLETRLGAVMNGAAAEHVREGIPVLASYCDALGIRAFADGKSLQYDLAETTFNAMAEVVSKPLINLESAINHPCQALADWKTMDDLGVARNGKFVLSWVYHPRACRSAVPAARYTWPQRGMEVVGGAAGRLRAAAADHEQGAQGRGSFRRLGARDCDPPRGARRCAGAVCEEWLHHALRRREADGRLRANLTDWCVKNEWFASAASDCRLMHCLPVRRNTAVADEVLDGPRSVVQREAYNRLVVQMAVLYKLLKGS